MTHQLKQCWFQYPGGGCGHSCSYSKSSYFSFQCAHYSTQKLTVHNWNIFWQSDTTILKGFCGWILIETVIIPVNMLMPITTAIHMIVQEWNSLDIRDISMMVKNCILYHIRFVEILDLIVWQCCYIYHFSFFSWTMSNIKWLYMHEIIGGKLYFLGDWARNDNLSGKCANPNLCSHKEWTTLKGVQK